MNEASQPMRPDDPMQRSGAIWCDDHDRWECKRQSKRSQSRCHGPAISGTATCRMHAGVASSMAKARGEVNRLAWSTADTADLPALDPGQAVMDQLRKAAMRAELLGELLRIQVEDQDYEGLVGRTHAAGREGARIETGEQPRGLAKLESDERDRVVRFAKAAHDMGIAERVIELHQGQAQLVVSAFVAGLAAVPTLLPADRDVALRTFLTKLGRGPEVLELEAGTVTA